MTEYMHLVGAEEVRAAASSMHAAADRMHDAHAIRWRGRRSRPSTFESTHRRCRSVGHVREAQRHHLRERVVHDRLLDVAQATAERAMTARKVLVVQSLLDGGTNGR